MGAGRSSKLSVGSPPETVYDRFAERFDTTNLIARKRLINLHVDPREQVCADREQDRGEAADHPDVGRGAEREAAA
jgi:hypothetical protein